MPTIAIIGASKDKSKFGNKAIHVYKRIGYTIYPINPKEDEIEGFKTYKSILDLPVSELDMVSLYLPPALGMKVIEDIAKLKVKEVWFNPGAESSELTEKAESLGLTVIEACSIVAAGSKG